MKSRPARVFERTRKLHPFGPAMIVVLQILSEGRDLKRLFDSLLDGDFDDAKSFSHRNGAWKQLAKLVRCRASGDVVILGPRLSKKSRTLPPTT